MIATSTPSRIAPPLRRPKYFTRTTSPGSIGTTPARSSEPGPQFVEIGPRLAWDSGGDDGSDGTIDRCLVATDVVLAGFGNEPIDIDEG